MSSDAIVMLREDHKEILRCFKDFEQAGENAVKRKGDLVDRMIELLTVHTYVENEVMYPRVLELVPDLEDDVLESYEEHHVEEEEQEWFPQVREALGRTKLQEIGAEMAEAKERAPRRPSQPSALKKTIDAVIS